MTVVEGGYCLVEITVYDPSLPGTKTLYFSESPGFITEPGDTPSNQGFEPRVLHPGNFEQHIFRDGTTSGRSETGAGEIILNNADGGLDDLLNYAFDGRQAIIRRGKHDSSYVDGFASFIFTMEQAEFSLDQITIRLRDRLAEVADKPLQAIKYDGSNSLPNGVEGVPEDFKGKPKPILKGVALNFAPPQVNTSQKIYQLSGAQIASIQNVYDQGAVVSAGTSRASLADLIANAPGGSVYDYYLGSGSDGSYIKLGFTPVGVITVDATEGATSADRTVAQIAQAILTDYAGVSPSDINAASVLALDTANNSEVGFWQGPEEVTIGQVMDEICQSIGAFWTANNSGEFVFGRLALPSGLPVAEIEEYHDIEFEIISSNDGTAGLPVFRVNLAYQRNHTVQAGSEVAGSVTEARKNFLKEEFRHEYDEDTSIQIAYLLAPELNITTLLNSASDAVDEATRLLDLFKVRRETVRLTAKTDQFVALNLNDVVQINISRFGWDSGKLMRVIGKVDNYENGIFELTLWG